ncbi:MAG: hypothetical protein Q4A15_07760, partial [Prevotellaceae bacterium]|nr:hypothetical protein [Prevotellaceae bacterium]
MKKKLIAILIVMAMLIQMVPAVAFADEADTMPMFNRGLKYAAIGDSIPAGSGLEADDPFAYRNFQENVTNSVRTSYPVFFAERLTADLEKEYKPANLGISAFSAQDYLAILTKPIKTVDDIAENYVFWRMINPAPSDYASYANEDAIKQFQFKTLQAMQRRIWSELMSSNLVSIQLGGDDLITLVILGLVGNNPDVSVQELISKFVDTGLSGLEIDDLRAALAAITAYLNNPTVENYSEIAQYVKDLAENKILVLLLGALELVQSMDSENNYEKINAFLKFTQTAAQNGLLSFKDLQAFIDIFDMTKLGDALAEGLDILNDDGINVYDKLVAAINRINPSAGVAIIGMYNPYGNSVELNGTRWTNAQVIAAIMAELAKIATEKEEPGVILPAPDVMDSLEETESVVEDIEKNPAVVEEKVEAAYEAVQAIDEAAEENVEPANNAALLASTEVSRDFEDQQDSLTEGILYAVVHNLLGGAVQESVTTLNYMMADASERTDAVFVNVYSEIKNESNMNPHPNEEGHKAITNALANKLISKITFDDNDLDADPMNGENENLEYALHGTKITVKVPDGAQFVVANNQRVWDANWDWCKKQLTKIFSYEINSPSTYIYAHLAGQTPINANASTTDPEVVTVIGDSIAAGWSMEDKNIPVGFTPDESYPD